MVENSFKEFEKFWAAKFPPTLILNLTALGRNYISKINILARFFWFFGGFHFDRIKKLIKFKIKFDRLFLTKA